MIGNFSEHGEGADSPHVFCLKNEQIEMPSVPLCTIEQLHEAEMVVGSHYQALFDQLKEVAVDHPWLEQKQLHSIIAQTHEIEVLDDLGFDLNDPNARLILFIGANHDLGRVIQALKEQQLEVPAEFETLDNHGQYSAVLLKMWGALEPFSSNAREIISHVVGHHADIKTPEPEDGASQQERIEYLFTCLIRDVDKLSVFMKEVDGYLKDENVKQGETFLMKKVAPDFQGEAGTINEEALRQFQERKPLDRRDCLTYEAYMLQLLSWIFDVNLNAITKKIVDCGSINQLLNYFQKQLPAEQYEMILTTTQNYLSSLSIELNIENG